MLDGEDPKAGGGELDRHLTACPECRAWREAAHEVTRRVRLGTAAQPAPRRAREVAAAVLAGQRRRRVRAVPLYRIGLVAAAAGQLAVAVPCLLLGEDRSAPVHVAHEMGSFDAALAVGFLVVAWRPGRALGMRAVVGAAAMLLVLTAVLDLAAGRTSVPDEAPHLLAVAGWLMIRGLAARTPPAVTEPRSRLAGAIRSRLPVLAWGAPDSARPGTPPAPGRRGVAGGCACPAGQCRCPGRAQPRRVASG